MNPLIRFPDKAIVMPLRLFGSVEYYAAMSAFGTVYIDDTTRFDKRQKAVHRYSIIDTQGPLDLTVPIAKPKVSSKAPIDLATPNVVEEGRKATWRDIALSSHGNWQHVHDVSLASAYGRTPFYEFYADRLKSFFAEDVVNSFKSIADYDLAADAVVRSILGITTPVVMLSAVLKGQSMLLNAAHGLEKHLDGCLPNGQNRTLQNGSNSIVNSVESTNSILPIEKANELIASITPQEYYQVRESRFGFVGNLSILDLIFNIGPEAPLHLHRLTSKLKTE